MPKKGYSAAKKSSPKEPTAKKSSPRKSNIKSKGSAASRKKMAMLRNNA